MSSEEPSPSSPAPEVPSSPKRTCPDETGSAEKQETLALLAARRDEYKRAALVAKKSGDTATAIGYIKVAKVGVYNSTIILVTF